MDIFVYCLVYDILTGQKIKELDCAKNQSGRAVSFNCYVIVSLTVMGVRVQHSFHHRWCSLKLLDTLHRELSVMSPGTPISLTWLRVVCVVVCISQ